MIKISSAFGYLGIAALLVAYQMTLSNSAKAQDAESAKIAATVPIADLHMHDGFGLPRKKTKFGKPKKKLLETRVMWGGLGTRRDRNHWLARRRITATDTSHGQGRGNLMTLTLRVELPKCLIPTIGYWWNSINKVNRI